jgi:hypothetical protein
MAWTVLHACLGLSSNEIVLEKARMPGLPLLPRRAFTQQSLLHRLLSATPLQHDDRCDGNPCICSNLLHW